ncbi:MAG: helix-turn-helix domain-containing protein [Polyangia bacterium]
MVQANPEAGGSGSGLIGPYLTTREVAARLRVCTATVYRLCEAGKLPHIRVSNAVRVGEDDLRRYLEGRTRRTR